VPLTRQKNRFPAGQRFSFHHRLPTASRVHLGSYSTGTGDYFSGKKLLGRKAEHSTPQNYWLFWTFPSSGILETRKHDVSETGSVSVLR
jgi:hypothetical protein